MAISPPENHRQKACRCTAVSEAVVGRIAGLHDRLLPGGAGGRAGAGVVPPGLGVAVAGEVVLRGTQHQTGCCLTAALRSADFGHLLDALSAGQFAALRAAGPAYLTKSAEDISPVPWTSSSWRSRRTRRSAITAVRRRHRETDRRRLGIREVHLISFSTAHVLIDPGGTDRQSKF
ncbi:hypothetical protein FRAHR75_330066 [Frankia sp. Hr75.2]|nr:hypothetical protein FRAHR75_330066 [Frankia sp. Hr75.2]